MRWNGIFLAPMHPTVLVVKEFGMTIAQSVHVVVEHPQVCSTFLYEHGHATSLYPVGASVFWKKLNETTSNGRVWPFDGADDINYEEYP